MTETRYKSNKYVHCYCEKESNVLVGGKLFGFLNPIAFVISTVFILMTLFSNAGIEIKIGIVALLGLPWWIGVTAEYISTKKHMLKAGHSVACSQKIAYWVMVYGSLWSDFKIMETKDDGKRVW